MVSETIQEDIESQKKKPKTFNKYAFGCTLLASMSCLLVGYDFGVLGQTYSLAKNEFNITDNDIKNINKITPFFNILGSAVAGRTCDLIGRRYTFLVTYVFYLVGSVLAGLATNSWFLVAGRSIADIAIGYTFVIRSVYVVELSPTSSRGFLVSLSQIFISTYMTPGALSKIIVSHLPLYLGWRLVFGINAILTIILIPTIFLMPESPRWLPMQGRLQEAFARFSAIKSEAGITQEPSSADVPSSEPFTGAGVWRDLIITKSQPITRIVVACLGFNIFINLGGLVFVHLHLPRLFEMAGIATAVDMQLMFTIVTFVKLLFLLVPTLLLDRVGRRPLILSSYCGIFVSLLGLGTAHILMDYCISPERDNASLCVWVTALCGVSTFLCLLFFTIGPGTIVWLYTAEILPARLRAQGVSMGVTAKLVMNVIVMHVFTSLYEEGVKVSWAYFMFAGFSVFAWVFSYKCLPETNGVALEDMEELFGNLRYGFDWMNFKIRS